MRDWPLRNVPIAAWAPESGEDLLAVPLGPDMTISGFQGYLGLLASRVNWMVEQEPDWHAILKDVFHGASDVCMTVLSMKPNPRHVASLLQDDMIQEALSRQIDHDLLGRVQSSAAAVEAIQAIGFETWAMLLREQVR